MKNIFAVDKPKGPTSNDILEKVRKLTGIRKVGHAGTLDPLACGVLVVGVGRNATRRLGEVVKKEKEYLATVKFGEESTTGDAEGEKRKFSVSKEPTLEEIRGVVSEFVGGIEQVPPIYSAVKIKGKEAYKRARAGEDFYMKPRKIEIKDIKILDYTWPFLRLRVVTGPGVYIRALARDIGRKLRVGGYLADLERTRVGEFTKDKTVPLKSLVRWGTVSKA